MRIDPPTRSSDTSQPPSPQYEVSEQIGHLLRKAYQRHLFIFGRSIDDPQLTAVQFAVLSASRKLGPSSMSDLGKATAIDAATVRGIIERLRARDLIELRTNRDDRRKVTVQLTQAGEELVEGVTPVARRISELTMSDLNDAERVAVLYLLRKLSAVESD
ncbi:MULTISPECIES: MarR family winged helix-turn-helix transcriptional regulator [Burkholderiaceae]|jgi:DNA-binding MarR family transcriptional regulator|uniref:Transcriptional regulator, MarR family n=1 Tax=Caballeronia sordidicola TaxID=196367 RepID=A0A242MIY1_CABSO|nr:MULTISPECIES: MarR family winged helix-turn-helix transcriptional regulator [Burkholderiaceae]AMH43327.1 MarR family transcriptional regulator [Burkholderia sp. PAMC 26561]OTP71266.1 Transcriptional regulator, MarR family [Caballeronia sordidicola]